RSHHYAGVNSIIQVVARAQVPPSGEEIWRRNYPR
ncbi:hypothetical protein TNCV_4358321, partial [Trichonephila clavipes]